MSLKSGLRLRPYIKRSVGVASVMGALLLGLSQTRANVGDTDESIHGEIAEALQLYLQLEFDQGIERAQGLFAR
ncbi:MAG: hypothetical protein ACE5GA_09385, partial [Candidatus Zixiibacteriota bacterium]